MPDTTSGASTQQVYSASGDQWSQRNNTNIVQNRTNLQWSVVPNHNMGIVASKIVNQSFIPNEVNGSVPIEYNPAPNYINISNPQLYQRQTNMQNGYPIIHIPNTQNMPAVPGRTPPRGPALPNTWATPQNIQLIKTGWNKTSSGGVKKHKRIRTAFTSNQMMELEQEYARTRYLDRSRRIELAEMLRLNERTIKIWFQNRRMKEKKDRAENHEENDDVTTTQSPPELGMPTFQEQYQANNEAFERMGVFIEQYPVSSTSMAPMTQAQMPAGSYATYAISEACPAQYQQVHPQVQHYPSSYIEVQKLSPESNTQSQSSVSVDINAPSDIVGRSWDLSWIKSMQTEDE